VLRAPRSTVDAAAAALQESGLRTSILAERGRPDEGARLLLFGPGTFLVATAFRFEPLPG
jgi:hypothetical protein